MKFESFDPSNPPSLRYKLSCIAAKHIPHRNEFSKEWYLPVWWCYLFGGSYDTGNGSVWRPNLYHTIKKYFIRRKAKKEELHFIHARFIASLEHDQQEYNKCQVQSSTDGGETYHPATPL